jgi:putative NADH-flavin reductase
LKFGFAEAFSDSENTTSAPQQNVYQNLPLSETLPSRQFRLLHFSTISERLILYSIMPTYAVLGATGNTGQSLLNVLTQTPSNKIHAYCRSRSKLKTLQPNVVTSPNVQVFEGSLSNQETIRDCIKHTHAVFLAVAVSGNVPGNTIARDTARVVIAALKESRDSNATIKLPKLIVLSAAAIEPAFNKDIPTLALNLLLCAESNIYNDLIAAESLLRNEQSWLSVTFVKPGALTIDTQKGHRLTMQSPKGVVSFMDLAAAMVEVADAGDEYEWKAVSVDPVAENVAFPWQNVPLLVKGLVYHFFPWAYQWLG